MNVKKILCIVLLAAVVLAVPISSSAADTDFVPGKVYLIKSDTTNYYVSTRGATSVGSAVYVDKTKAGNYRVGYDPKQLWYVDYPTGMWAIKSQGAHKYMDSSCVLKTYDSGSFYEVPKAGVGTDGVTLYSTSYRYLTYDKSTLRLGFTSKDKATIWYFMPAYSLDHPTTNFGTQYYDNSTFTDFPEGQCTWYVAGRVQEKLGITLLFTSASGNDAKTWYDRIDNDGIIKSNSPSPNSIAVFGSSTTAGHVVLIEYIEDGYVYYSEANYGSSANGRFDIGVDGVLKRQTIAQFENRSSTNKLIGYINLNGVTP